MSTVRVFHYNRAAGCDERLLDFLGWWQVHGPHVITIPETGGPRYSQLEQRRLFVAHKSMAKTLEDTPHGRCGALDAYPAILDPTGRFVAGIHLDASAPEAKALFLAWGEAAESCGLKWGGRFLPIDPITGLGWDCPHIEVPDWQSLPFPPQPKES